MKKYTFSDEEKQEIKKAREKNRDKNVEKRLEALALRAEGKRNKEISEKTGFHTQYITVLVSRYKSNGLLSITENHYHGNRRNLSYEEEEAVLEPFRQAAKSGKMVSVRDIEAAYREAVGHSIGTGQIYYVLHRHGWRKIMPRSRHPKKAGEEVIETSKKLTNE
jgi:transposase